MPTVVIADDSPTLRRIVSTVLEREGYTVVQAEDGVEAVQAVFRHMPDAIVLDVQMPRVSGYVAARLLKDDWRTADIPILSAHLTGCCERPVLGRPGGCRPVPHQRLRSTPARRGRPRGSEQAAMLPVVGDHPCVRTPSTCRTTTYSASISDLLDRKLFESSIAAEVTGIASGVHGFEETIAEVLDVLSRVVDYDLASVLMLDDRSTYIRVARETSQQQYASSSRRLADAASDCDRPVDVAVGDLQARVADPRGTSEPRTRARWPRSCPCR